MALAAAPLQLTRLAAFHAGAAGTAVLALDLGTCTGWALQERGGRICSGSQPFRPQRYEGGGMRFLRFQRWLTELSQSHTSPAQPLIDQVVFEEVRRHAGVDAAHAYGGFLGQLGSFCEHHRIPYQGVPVGTIKRFITGKGNASKEQVIAAVRDLGHSPVDDNEADALALLHWAIASGTAAAGGSDG
jgi:Holliday junction resolvasome RuvABC endonuclease subunit